MVEAALQESKLNTADTVINIGKNMFKKFKDVEKVVEKKPWNIVTN